MTGLFYPAGITRAQLVSLVYGVANVADLGLDVLAFADPPAPLDRELAVPLLGGMDEVEVSEARLRLRARARALEITAWSTTTTTGTDAGIVLVLAAPVRLRKVVIDAPAFPDGMPVANLHAVVRTATKAGGGFTLGPPVFAAPPFSLPSPMYAPILGGLTVTTVSGGRRQFEFPSTSGSAWLFQYATGTDAASLTPVRFTSVVRTVTIDAAPSDVTVALAATADDDEDVVLWSHPGVLLPDVGEQQVSFTPLAQRRLSARLATAGSTPTLPVSLVLRSATAGDLVVAEAALSARYRVKPLVADPLTLALGGGWADLTLRAPGELRPAAGALQAAVRHLGRELNGGSPEPPRALPDAGVRVDADRWAAVATPVEGSAPLVSARALLAASAAAEAVVELRAGGAGGPGRALGAPVVVQLEPGPPGWVEFELTAALEQPPPEVWLVLRATHGSVRWFARAGGAEVGRISLDRGATWGELEPSLVPRGAPLGLLFHRLDGELPLPQVRLELAGAQLTGDLLAGAERTGPASFALAELAVPEPVLTALGATAGAQGARVDTTLSLFSRAVAELTLSGAALTYDPFGG